MWSDRETENDLLGFHSYVEVLAEVALQPALAPLTLGIFGSWGSGKTSLMRMLKRRIEPSDEASKKKTKTLWFNAWRYEGREEAQAALIHAILARLTEDKTLGDDVKDTLKRLKDGASILKLGKFIGKTLLTMTPDIGGFIDCFREESEKVAATMEGFEKDFEHLLAQLEVEHIVVFIDDLDRCSSVKVIETFETIKLFLNVPACTFVIGADAHKIEQAVGEVYSVSDERRRRDYLEKIVQLPFNIPEQGLDDLGCYVGMLVAGQSFENETWKRFCEARPQFLNSPGGVQKALASWIDTNRGFYNANHSEVLGSLNDTLKHVAILARGLRGNPRQVKRFLNILSLRRRLGAINKLNVSSGILIKLSVLEYSYPTFFEELAMSLDPETGKSDLAAAVAGASSGKQDAEPSEIVSRAVGLPGLVEYLAADPILDPSLDLRPYFVLAQTALNRGASQEAQPIDDVVNSIVEGIETDDPQRARPAARKAVAAEQGVAAAVVRRLTSDLGSLKNPRVQVNVVAALDAVCTRHPALYQPTFAAIASLDPKVGEYLSVAVTTLIKSAKRVGQAAPAGLGERFSSESPIAKALNAPLGGPPRLPRKS